MLFELVMKSKSTFNYKPQFCENDDPQLLKCKNTKWQILDENNLCDRNEVWDMRKVDLSNAK